MVLPWYMFKNHGIMMVYLKKTGIIVVPYTKSQGNTMVRTKFTFITQVNTLLLQYLSIFHEILTEKNIQTISRNMSTAEHLQ